MVSLASFQSSSLQHDFLGGEIMVPFQVKYTLDINVVEKLDGCGRAYCDILQDNSSQIHKEHVLILVNNFRLAPSMST